MDFKEAFNQAPLPILIYQDGRVVYGNAVAYDLCRLMGLEVADGRIHEVDVMSLAPQRDLQEIQQDIRSILELGQTLLNVPRALCDSEGNGVSTLISGCPVTWEGRPAVEVSLVVVGFFPVQPVAEAPCSQGEIGVQLDARTDLLHALTPRETQVALLVSEGKTDSDVCAVLGIRKHTLRGYLKSIYRKLEVHSRSELVLRVLGHR